jgi:hypothetical protein
MRKLPKYLVGYPVLAFCWLLAGPFFAVFGATVWVERMRVERERNGRNSPH